MIFTLDIDPFCAIEMLFTVGGIISCVVCYLRFAILKFLTVVVNTHCVGFWEEGIEMRNMRLEIESMGIILRPKI